MPNKIYIDNSPIHGLGVFANQTIYEGEIIEICPVIDMGLNRESSPILIDYRFNWPQGNEWITQVVPAGYGMLYNHSNTPNSNWRSNDSQPNALTIRPQHPSCSRRLFNYINSGKQP